ncbi:histidine kinase [Ornithinimicrobium sp. F0845]|uniref:sensor histidine kinase n=1 Tax=Ornithinimicrobium sp. F0845 TaxID=2926412 RepID=UPI001FF27229|nr:histidine kinase [Ornithinimicrobium sp. F0845]MCK0110700.1 histidine kinase [Ornithinimicrobium sp. F0845]
MSSTALPRPGLLRQWWQGWAHVAFLVLNLLTGLVALALVLCLLIGVILLAAAGLGLLLLWPTLWLTWLFAKGERSRIEAFTSHRIVPRETSGEPPWVTTLGVSSAHRRAAAYSGLHALWGLLTGALTSLALATCVAVLTLPLTSTLVTHDEARLFGLVPLEQPGAVAAAWIAALAVLLVAPFAARHLTQVDAGLARSLLGQDPEEQIAHLSERVETLTTSRSETVDSVEVERRRIERDLHDGPQQRLVAIAMDLGMARERLARDPDGAGELLDKAHLAAKEAITEMRHVARGITPPILADRGLDAAVSALAARSAVPVTVEAAQIGRLDPTTEAIGYFCVSELLTNVAKHARADRARVRLALDHGLTPPALVIEVEDDGVGGADPRGGSGLNGLRQRVMAVDGVIHLESPGGGPTRVQILLPARRVPAADPYGPPPPGPPPTGTGTTDPRHDIPTPDTAPEETR